MPGYDLENVQAPGVVVLKTRNRRTPGFKPIHFRLDAADFIKKVVPFPEPDQFLRHIAEARAEARCNLFSEMAISQPHKLGFCTDLIGTAGRSRKIVVLLHRVRF